MGTTGKVKNAAAKEQLALYCRKVYEVDIPVPATERSTGQKGMERNLQVSCSTTLTAKETKIELTPCCLLLQNHELTLVLNNLNNRFYSEVFLIPKYSIYLLENKLCDVVEV